MLWLPVATYLFVINAATYAAYAIDKSQARERGYRISESTLLWLGFFGGSPAAFAAQRILHHKTHKQPFQNSFRLMIVLQIALIVAFLIAASSDDLLGLAALHASPSSSS
jgi:uncharacterized membrane protein YsdA (DUF1294 family)